MTRSGQIIAMAPSLALMGCRFQG
ncbi:MAG: hypothetical protein AB4042_01030 [Leptolyngbyaceae cyanobacterium]